MDIDITTPTYPNIHTENIVPPHLDTSNNTNIVLFFDNSIDYISPTIIKKQ